jgi:hypothetical protein
MAASPPRSAARAPKGAPPSSLGAPGKFSLGTRKRIGDVEWEVDWDVSKGRNVWVRY